MKSIKAMPSFLRHRDGLLVKRVDQKIGTLIHSFLNEKSVGAPETHKINDREFYYLEGFFDEDFYSEAYPDLNSDDLRNHFIRFGQFESRWPNPLFECDFYYQAHSLVCDQISDDRSSIPMHFLECDKFTCPSPLLELETQEDVGGQLRGLYLSIVYGLLDGDNYAVKGFDSEFVRRNLQKTLSQETSLTLDKFSSMVYAYAFLSANLPLFALNADANFLIDEKHVNHVLGSQSFPRSVLSWVILSEKTSDISHIQLSTEFDILKIVRLLDRRIQSNSIVETIKERSKKSTELVAVTKPKVSILMICLDNAKMVIASLGVLLIGMSNNYVEILILDNASNEEDSEFLRQHANFATIIRRDIRVSFGEANNILGEVANGDYLLLLNSDAFITSDGIQSLAIELDENSAIAATAPILYYPDGLVQESGGAWFDDGSVVQFAKGLVSAQMIRVDENRVYRSASCLMVRRDIFERVGGFNYVFEPAYFEDTFLCAELTQIGEIKTMPRVRAVHLEGFTTNKPDHNFDKQLTISLNRQKFVERVSDLELIAERNFQHGATVQREPRPVALIVSPYGLMIGGGEQYLLTLAAHLSQTHQIVLAYPQIPSRNRFRRVLWDLGISEFEVTLVDFPQALWLRPDLLISMGNSLLPNFPPIGRRSIYHCQFPFPDHDSNNSTRISWAEAYDALVVQSTFTANEVALTSLKQWNGKVHVIAPPVNARDSFVEDKQPNEKDPTKFRIVSVGRFFEGQHCKNQIEMVQAFTELAKDFDFVELVLMGGVAPDRGSVNYLRKVVGESASKNISIRPDVSRKSVIRELRRGDLYWHATGLGVGTQEPWRMEHFGIAPIEACQLGLFPMVHDSGGAGLNLRQLSDFCIYEDLDQLVDMTRTLINRGTPPVVKNEIIAFGNKFSVIDFENTWDLLLKSLLQ